MYNFSVFMSTYNGEKYLREQLDSILSQKSVNLSLYIRDDGSSDNTVSIIFEYMDKYENIYLFKGENLGYVKSFMWLVQHVGVTEGMYYAFADQDDYWDENKLYAAAKMISSDSSQNIPILYYSDLDVVDSNLNYIRKGNVWEGTINRFMMLMFIGIRGCTIVYNSNLQSIICSNKPEYVSSHDAYFAIIAFWTGKVLYDKNAYIKYRQTGNNTSITGVGSFDALKKNVLYLKKRFGKMAHQREMNAKSVLNCYYDYLNEPELIEKVANYRKSIKNKIKLLRDKRYFCFHKSINIANRILIVFGKL